jgi:hypothetical protein
MFGQDHMIHIERLRQSKPTIAISAPKKPVHMTHNMKKELQNLGKYSAGNDRICRTNERNTILEQTFAQKDAIARS